MRRLLAVALIAVTPGLLYAQGRISGQVTDRDGRPLPGVVISAEPDITPPRTASAVTDTAGRYVLANLADGVYAVRFTLPGFQTDLRSGVTVSAAGPAATVDSTLQVASPAEGIQSPSVPPRAPGQRQAACLHGNNETAVEAARRSEALAAMRLIYQVLESLMQRPFVPLPAWDSLGDAAQVAVLRRRPDALGDLARKIQWGASEPLPGWGIAYVARGAEIRFALIDLRDPCGFSYSSTDPDVIPRVGRIVPLDSTARN